VVKFALTAVNKNGAICLAVSYFRSVKLTILNFALKCIKTESIGHSNAQSPHDETLLCGDTITN